MSKEQKEEKNELSLWMSTYGLVTAERILEHYKIRLQQDELYSTMKNPHAFYHRLLRIPLKNVFNGIILQQAYDYQVYAQKLFVDYLMSGESSKPEEAVGGFTREDIEAQRKRLVEMADSFQKCELAHNKLIAESQKALIAKAEEWLKALSAAVAQISSGLEAKGIRKNKELLRNVVNVLLVHLENTEKANEEAWNRAKKIFEDDLSTDVKQVFMEGIAKLNELNREIENFLAEFAGKINEMGLNLRNWRSSFYNLILRTHDLLKFLPEYQANQAQTQENQEALYFDSGIGEDKEK